MEIKSRTCAIAPAVLLVLLGCALGESNVFEGSQQEVDVKVR